MRRTLEEPSPERPDDSSPGPPGTGEASGERAPGSGVQATARRLASADTTPQATLETISAPARRPAADEPEELAAGRSVGRYLVKGKLGAGGMGVVYRATDPALDRDVALKVLRGDVNPARLGWEAKAMARLRHPHVVTVLDIGSFETRAYFVMELVEGQSLRGWLRAKKRGLLEILEAYVACGRGLAAAHEAGIVHRDFKPDNAVVDRDGTVRVLDFGLAHWADQGTEGERSTAIAGTPGYMPPEQMSGALIDARADQFAFCVALWEAVVGSRPFHGTYSELLAGIRSGELPPIPRTAHVPPWLERVLRRGLAAEASRRFAAMKELIAALEAGIARLGSASRVVADRYELLRAGAVGVGSRALDRLTGGVVTVVKNTPTDPIEARELLALRHPNLVAILEVGVDDEEETYGVLDLQEPPVSLRSVVDQRSPPRQAQLALGVLRALAHLHARGIHHGPLADADVLVVGGQVKLLHLRRAANGSAAADVAAVAALFGPAMFPEGARARMTTVPEALEVLASTLGGVLELETAETRESSLHSAPLTGREDESRWIDEILAGVQTGRGGAWLIVGESGVGKSRLLAEIGGRAMAFGMMVLTGQEQREGGRVHGSFAQIALRLAFDPELSELEAAVLAAIAPSITGLLGREIGPAPSLDGAAVHSRLVEILGGILERQTRSVVILVEDVQWSHADSLRLLEALARSASDTGFLVVASCRDDAPIDVPRALPSMKTRKLARLDGRAMEEMTRAILGRSLPPGLSGLLARETEGNAFFLVEVLRALADEAGSFDGISSLDLPATVFAGGVRRLVQARLARVPENTLEPLRVAALIGRTLDLTLLTALCPELDLAAWLAACLEGGVVEAHEGGHRFWHDKLREALLDLDEAERAKLHLRIARAMVELHSGDPARWAALTHHFGGAGDRVHEARFAALAGEHAVESGAFVEGRRLLERAVELADEAGSSREERAKLQRLLGEASYCAGDLSGAVQHHSAVLALAGERPPSSSFGWALLIVRQAVVYLVLGRTRSFLRADGARAIEFHEASRSGGRLSFVFTYGMNSLGILGLGLLAVNFAERAGKANAFALAFVAYALGCGGLHGASRRAYALAKQQATASDDWPGLLGVLLTESVLAASRGDFDTARTLLAEKRALADRVGDRVGAANAEGVLAASLHLQGDVLGMTERYRRSHVLLPPDTGDHAALYAMGYAHGLTVLGRRKEAGALLDACDERITAENRLARSRLAGTLAHYHALGGDLEAAMKHADACIQHYRSGPAVDPVAAVVFEGPMEAVCRSLEATTPGGPDTDRLWRAARAQERQLALWTRVSPTGRPLRTRFRGKLELLSGRHEAGCRTLEISAAEARAQGMPLYEGLALADLGRALAMAGQSSAKARLEEARELFVRTSARAHLDELDALTSASTGQVKARGGEETTRAAPGARA